MNSDQQRNRLAMPLPPMLLDYIMHEYPQTGPIIVSTVEYTVKESKNHYMDIMRALEPLLRDGTKAFVDKLFMFRRKMCRDAHHCVKSFCLFAHNDDELVSARRPGNVETPVAKRPRIENAEIVLSHVDELRFTIDDLREYAEKYGAPTSVRRLAKGNYLVGFDDSEAAKKLVECPEAPLGDPEIKKCFNVPCPIESPKRVELGQLFQDQKDILECLTTAFDVDALNELKSVTQRIREQVLGECDAGDSPLRKEEFTSEIESSPYYSMFAE